MAPSESRVSDPWFNLSAIPKLGQDMRIRGIRKDLLSLLLQLGREQHPNEFAGLLREQDGVIEEIDLLPGTTSNEFSASLFLDMMPLDTHLAGSVHSHPNGVIFPSDADLGFFPRTGRYHIIVGFPYEEDDWRCFSASGTPVDIGVVE
jgi:proteasome lid subunit RPN8/RPN11